MCWIKLYRKFTEWEWYSDVNCKVVFLHLLLTANWKPKKWKGIETGVGELVIGREALAEAVGISVQQCRTALKKLVSSEAIEVESTKQFSKIKILNYKSYQNQPTTNQGESTENTDVGDSGVFETNQQLTNQLTNNQPTEQPTNNQPEHLENTDFVSDAIEEYNQPTNQQSTNRATTTKEYKNNRIKEYKNNSCSSNIYNINNIYSETTTAASMYQQNVGVLTPLIADILRERVEAQGEEIVQMAIAEAVECGVRNIRYIEKILISWQDSGLHTVDSIKLRQSERRSQNGKNDDISNNVKKSKFRNYPESYEISEEEKAQIDKMMQEYGECG